METIEITEEQRRQNQVDFAEFMLERKRQAKKEMQEAYKSDPIIKSIITEIKAQNAQRKATALQY
jgi:hypothetical protein